MYIPGPSNTNVSDKIEANFLWYDGKLHTKSQKLQANPNKTRNFVITWFSETHKVSNYLSLISICLLLIKIKNKKLKIAIILVKEANIIGLGVGVFFSWGWSMYSDDVYLQWWLSSHSIIVGHIFIFISNIILITYDPNATC